MREPIRILVVCTGNLCRSPMAAAYFRQRLRQLRIPAEVQSAGIMAQTGSPATPYACQMVEEIGASLASHRAQPLTPTLIQWAHWIFVMEPWHRAWIRGTSSIHGDKVVLLGSYVDGLEDSVIPDPYGDDRPAYELVWRLIRHAIDAWLDSWLTSDRLKRWSTSLPR